MIRTHYLLCIVLISLTTMHMHAHTDITFIIFGASGDLATRDLIPALFRLYHDNALTHFAIVGTALACVDKYQILNQSKKFIHTVNPEEWDAFAQHFYYQDIDCNDCAAFEPLNMTIQQVERTHGLSGNRLVYCATSCNLFIPITQNLVNTGILVKQAETGTHAWHRIAYEKPFGFDEITASAIEECATTLLAADQIFHIDHFLMTEVMKHLPRLRFTYRALEQHWNNNEIKKVDILFKETLDIGARGTFYDKVGSLLDVVQNHMFQMLALIAMEEPEKLDPLSLQFARAQIIKNTHFVDGFLGQYNGYTQERDVPQSSTTDTFSALQCAIETPRWHGVPFYLITGKCLHATEICMRITFAHGDCCTLWIAPYPKLEYCIHAYDAAIDPLSMEYNYSNNDSYSTDIYKNILVALCTNDRSIDVSFEEIQAAWRLIAQIQKRRLPLYMYDKESAGPAALQTFNLL